MKAHTSTIARSVIVMLLCLCIVTSLYGQTDVLRATHSTRLKDLARKQAQRYMVEREQALIKARQEGSPAFKILRKDVLVEVQGIDDGGRPLYYCTYNLGAAQTVSTDRVWPEGSSGLSLTGTGMTIGEWDGGAVRGTHRELTGRVTQVDGATNIVDHSTHVAGSLIATGVTALAKGMSYQAHLDAYDWDDDFSEMASAAASGLLISNHSYGGLRGWVYGPYDLADWAWFGDTRVSTTKDYLFGFYDTWARTCDSIAALAPYYLTVAAAGNDREEQGWMGSRPYYVYDWTAGEWVLSTTYRDPDGPYDCVSHMAGAKNVLTVGAVYEIAGGYSLPADVVMTSFSCWGPTDDGRIKPDVVAKGDKDPYSTLSCIGTADDAYNFMSGTSMASPSVAGSLLLVQQHYGNTHSGQSMLASTLKGLAIHTADEAGSYNGPDYQCGWGLLNTAKACSLISRDWDGPFIRETTLSNGSTYSIDIYSLGTEPLVATLCWTDPPGTCPAPSLDPRTKMLVNDLDVRITKSGATYAPWVLNVNSPASAATTGDNTADNVEKVFVASPTQGWYSVQVTHKGTLQGGQQQFALITSGWTRYSNVGSAICVAADSQQCQQSVSDGNGGAIIAWQDRRNGKNDIYAQRVNAGGQVVWGSNGVAICVVDGDQRYPQLVSDGAGGAIITWQGTRPGSSLIDIWAQRVNSSGSVLWTANGKIVLSKDGDQVKPQITSGGGSGAIIVCEDRFSPPSDVNVVAQRLDANGNQQWGSGGVMLCTAAGTQTQPHLVSDGAGGAIFSWSDTRSSVYGDIYAQRLDAGGSLHSGWTTDGVPICVSSTADQLPLTVTDGASGAVIAWRALTIPYPEYVRAQRIDANGSIHTGWLTNGVSLNNPKQVISLVMVSDGAGGAILTWSAMNNMPVMLYARRVAGDGTFPWTVQQICGGPPYAFSPENPAMAADGTGGAVIAWSDSRNSSTSGSDIYAQRIAADGVMAWQSNGVSVSTATNTQTFPVLSSQGVGEMLVAWMDYRAGTSPDIYAHTIYADGGLPVQFSSFAARMLGEARGVALEWMTLTETNNYGFQVERKGTEMPEFVTLPNSFVPGHGTTLQPQRYSYLDGTTTSGLWWYRLRQIDLDGTVHNTDPVSVGLLPDLEDPSLPRAFALLQNYPNPFNPLTTIRYGLPHKSTVLLTIFNTLGQHVETLVEGEQGAGYHEAKFNASGLPSGVYFYRLRTGDRIQTRKLLLLR